MGFIGGVHLLPATGEFTYDTLPHTGALGGAAQQSLNTFLAPGGTKTDYSYAIDQLQAAHPECTTVSVVCAWFGNSLDAAQCQIYPSTNFSGGAFEQWSGSGYVTDTWRVSGLTQLSSGLIPLPALAGGGAVYGGTPSDQSIVRCIHDLKARGFRVMFYPFVLMTAVGYPWRGRITYTPDMIAAATSAANAFLGLATRSQFTPDPTNLTVAYSGPQTDYTYRRMILHYAWLCTVAGGVDLFVIGSELRGLETIRGPGWTPAGTTDGSGYAVWDYPFVAGLKALASDVRAIFDGRGLTKTIAALKNLITYSADWSDWMGFQHPGANGQWPHLDALWADPNIDVVGTDNYLPLSDWTTGDGGLDARTWLAPRPEGAWPPSLANMSGLGLTGAPTLYSLAYLKGNIEGGEKFSWWYRDDGNAGPGLDPNGSDLIVSQPQGDRLTQTRSAFAANQQALANKQFRWWWKNTHQAIYDNGDGHGWVARGPQTGWQPQSKPICFVEYGYPATDKGANQPNVFFDAKSTESATPYWSIWNPVAGGGLAPRRDDTIARLAQQAMYEYWNADGNNETSSGGVPLIQFAFCCVWSWDARPFPVFPLLSGEWGDAGNWQTGDWINGRGPSLTPPPPSAPPGFGAYAMFPSLAGLRPSIRVRTRFATDVAGRASGRSSRHANFAAPLLDFELSFEGLRSDAAHLEMQQIAAFFEITSGSATPFWFAPPGLSTVTGQVLGRGDGLTLSFPLALTIGSTILPIVGTSGVSAVYIDRVAASASQWTAVVGYPPAVAFTSPPVDGAIITADFSALWLCRFADDALDFEEFMAMLFTLGAVRLQAVRL
jgi:uncharacterized protein (TIGR02217 family)